MDQHFEDIYNEHYFTFEYKGCTDGFAYFSVHWVGHYHILINISLKMIKDKDTLGELLGKILHNECPNYVAPIPQNIYDDISFENLIQKSKRRRCIIS